MHLLIYYEDVDQLRERLISVWCELDQWRAVNRRPTPQKIWGGFLYGVYRPGDDFELIPAVKWKRDIPSSDNLVMNSVDL